MRNPSKEKLKHIRSLSPRSCRACGNKLPKPTWGHIDRVHTDPDDKTWYVKCEPCNRMWYAPLDFVWDSVYISVAIASGDAGVARAQRDVIKNGVSGDDNGVYYRKH